MFNLMVLRMNETRLKLEIDRYLRWLELGGVLVLD